jgi:hypothetical protein
MEGNVRHLRWILLALAAVLAVGCGISGRTTGSLELRFADFQGQRSIMPPISITVNEYVVSGTGPGSTSFGPVTVTGATSIDNLVPGPWVVNVVGRNASHTAIGAGSGTVTVVIGQSRPCAITVVEYDSPNGVYQLNLTYEPDIVENPVWSGTLKDAASVVTPQVFTADLVACTATSTTADLHPGWYANVVQLHDGTVLSTGFAEAVRIVAGQTTTADVALHAVQGFGEIEIILTADFSDPLVLTPDPPFGATAVITVYDRTFTVTAYKAAVFVWFIRCLQV